MITVGMNYSVLEGKEKVFENAFQGVIKALNKAEGHESSHLYRDVSASTEYLIVSEWSDESAFQAFITSEAFRNVTNWGKEQILAGRPSHRVYQEGQDVSAR